MGHRNNLFTSAVIVAAGRGSRMNMDKNKQYIDIKGKPVIARTLQAFEDNRFINEIVLVVNERDILYCKQAIVEEYGFNKVKTLVAGGNHRQESVYNGLCEVSGKCEVVLIHDGARPFVRDECIEDSIHAADEFSAACVAVPVKDTIKISDVGGFIKQTLDRSVLWSIQTPQAFKFDVALKAHRRAIEQGYTGTDDAVLAERLGYKVKLVMGGYDNIKITTQEDLNIAEAIAEQY